MIGSHPRYPDTADNLDFGKPEAFESNLEREKKGGDGGGLQIDEGRLPSRDRSTPAPATRYAFKVQNPAPKLLFVARRPSGAFPRALKPPTSPTPRWRVALVFSTPVTSKPPIPVQPPRKRLYGDRSEKRCQKR